jgi:alcohol dehydrogenase (cytochrome c)
MTKQISLFRRVGCAALFAAGAIALPSLAGAQQKGPGFDDPTNWPQYHRSYNAWRFSPLDQINKTNVKKLKVAWIHQAGNITLGLQATPIEIDGVMYLITADNHVWALDAATGKMKWDYQAKLDPISKEAFYHSTSRGVTVGRGKVYIGSLDGRFIALDQATGKELWSTQLSNLKAEWGALFSSPPQLAGNVLFGGTTGGDQPGTGKIYAVNADTGERVWTFEVPRNDPKSWPGDSRKKAGSSAWMPGTYDPTTDTIYIGTSNASPDYYTGDRQGDNLYTSTLLALEPATGKVKWYRQEVPNDSWDFDSAYEALLIPHDGKTVLVHLNKNGFVYVMDKDNGDIKNVWQFAENMNWTTGVDPKTGLPGPENRPEVGKQKLFCPNLLGARSWNAGAYNPKTKLWYSHGMEVCNTVTSAKASDDEVPMSGLTLGLSEITLVDPPGKTADGYLAAFEPYTGKVKWKKRFDLPPLSCVLTTGGGLVFTGDMRGMLYAFDADDGKELWSFNSGSGARGGPISYSVNGKQYISIPTGLGSLAPGFLAGRFPEIKNLPAGATLITFTLE